MMHSDHSENISVDDGASEKGRFSEQQANAYSALLPVYESRHDLLQPIRHVVLDRVLDQLPDHGTVLEVGCGCGASLALMSERGFRAEGIDLSPDMAGAARDRSGCNVICGDFRNLAFRKHYDLVFAQAFVHLFPKAAVEHVIQKLQEIALRRVYFSTTRAANPSEGWEEKDGVLRYRSRYTASELRDLVARVACKPRWNVQWFELCDPLGKQWLNVLLDRVEPEVNLPSS